MKFVSKVGERGQVVIPKKIRDTLGLSKSATVEFELKGTTAVLSVKRTLPDFELARKRYGACFQKQFQADGYNSVDEYIKEVRGR